MNKLFWIKAVAISGLLSVLIGAFAAHALETSISAQRMDTLYTAVKYQMFHSLALFGLVCVGDEILALRWKKFAAAFFLLGMILFSGSLYLLVATNISSLGMITPFGGIAFITGWVMLFLAAIREK
jgi:uncharacterized membrane protein YgdD (TMEM256/DUF423 family)